jgi:hypothetical protein
MAEPSKPDPTIVMVPVKRYDVELSLEDIMKPLTAFVNKESVGQAIAQSPDMQQHAEKLSDLAQQVLDVAKRIQAISPDVLSSKPPSR